MDIDHLVSSGGSNVIFVFNAKPRREIANFLLFHRGSSFQMNFFEINFLESAHVILREVKLKT